MKHGKNIDEAKLNGAAWVLHNKLVEYGTLNASQFNNMKECLSCAIKDYLEINKPREFVKGNWYPCIVNHVISVLMWDGEALTLPSRKDYGYAPDSFDEVGESLGEIKFGD